MCELPRPLAKRSEFLKSLGLLLQAQKVAGRRWKLVRRVGQLWQKAPGHDDAIRIRERQRTQQSRIDNAEDCSVHSNPERQSDHGNRGEARSLYETANRVADVLK